MTLQEHIEQLARDAGVFIQPYPEPFAFVPPDWFGGSFDPELRTLYIHPVREHGWMQTGIGRTYITENIAYYTAMHELGHANDRALPPFSPYLSAEVILYHEALAWQWALDNALVPPDETGRDRARAALMSYARGLGAEDAPPIFHDTLRRIAG